MNAATGSTRASSLFQDWYDTYVRPKKAPISLSSSAPQDLSLGLPASATPIPSAPVVSPATEPLQDYTPTPAPEPAALAPSWSENLNKGLQDPAKMGLLTAGLSMMATPPRAVPYSNTEILGQAGLAGVSAYERALESKHRQQALDKSMEEKKLSREDRRTAAEDRGQYYRDVAETRRLTAESQAEARKATTAENAVLDVPIPSSVAKHYDLPPETTVRMFNKMQAGLTAMVKPEKEAKTDPFTEWYRKRVEETGKAPNAKEIERWHRNPTVGGAGVDSGPGKVGAIGAVSRDLVAQYLPLGRANLEAKGPSGMEELKGMMVMLGNTDQLGGPITDARLRESLSVDQRKEYDFVKRKAQDYSRTMTPANAVARAQEDWKAKNQGAPAKLPAAAPVKPGVTAKKVKMPDGSIQEFDAAGNRVK
jgi:hypothetical protein